MMYVQSSKGKPIQEIMSDRDGSYWGFVIIPVIIFLFIQYRKSTVKNLTPADGL